MRIILSLILLLSLAPDAYAAPEQADRYTVPVLAYQFIGIDDLPNASLRTDQFNTHLETTRKGYKALHPANLNFILRGKKTSPEKSFLITFDLGLKNQYENAFPALIAAQIPFLVFIDPQAIDARDESLMGWAEIQKLQKTGLVSFGYQPQNPLPTDTKALTSRLNAAQARLRDIIGKTANLFAYTNGIYSSTTASALKKTGFTIAFTQASGPASSSLDLYAQPRFVMTENYGDPDRFVRALNSLPLPVRDITPSHFNLKENPPLIGLTLSSDAAAHYKKITCFASDNIIVKKQLVEQKRLELRLEKPFPHDRGRVNCIMPESDDEDSARWRWLGFLFGY